MITVRTPEEIELIRDSSLMVGATIAEVAKILKPGLTTSAIDDLIDTFIRDNGGIPSFKDYQGTYPAASCLSVNEQVVHGIPGKYQLKDGDIISVDCGFYRNGYHGDSAYTFAIGNVVPEILTLMRVTKESLYKGVAQAAANNRIGDIGHAIEEHTFQKHGYGVVRELVGHGIGQELHEEPNVPNVGRRGEGKKLKEGYVIAIEPMINLGTKDVSSLDDKWTIVTRDGKASAHYEHTTVVRKAFGEPLSSFDLIEAAEKANPELESGYY